MQKRVKTIPRWFTLVELVSVMTVCLILLAASAQFFTEGLNLCRLASRKTESHDAIMALHREWRAFVHANGAPQLCTDQLMVFAHGKLVEAKGNQVLFDWGGDRTKRYQLLPNFTASLSFDDASVENLVTLNLTWRQSGSGLEIPANNARLVACPVKGAKEVTK